MKTFNNKNRIKKEQDIMRPISIAFVKMVEKGDIDEVTASENASMFLEWREDTDYNAGDLRTDDGELYKSLQAHKSQAGWNPKNTPALWKKVGINEETGVTEWSQPISSADAYMKNDETSHGGKIWVSDYDNNVWEPGVFGWHLKEE